MTDQQNNNQTNNNDSEKTELSILFGGSQILTIHIIHGDLNLRQCDCHG